MKRLVSFLLYGSILLGSVFTLFYVFKIQIEDKKQLETMSILNRGFKQISKVAIDQLETSDFEAIFEGYSQNGKNPGLAIGITFGVRTFPFYFGNTQHGGTPLNDQTYFEIGAVTQPFTGLLLARMLELQQLPTDPLLNQILGSVTPSELKQIKLIDLATHTSGFPKMPPGFPQESFPSNPFERYGAKDLWNSLNQIKIDKTGAYAYSNYGYAVLGEVLARFRGVPYPQLLRREILDPLRLHKMRFGSEGEPPQPFHFATPHRKGEPTVRLPLHSFDPAGGLCATLPELTRFLNIMTYPDRSPFPQTLKLTLKPWQKPQENLITGLGWYISKHPYGTIIWKNGGAGGFRSYVAFWDDLPLGVVVLGNSDDEMIDKIGLRILQALRELN